MTRVLVAGPAFFRLACAVRAERAFRFLDFPMDEGDKMEVAIHVMVYKFSDKAISG